MNGQRSVPIILRVSGFPDVTVLAIVGSHGCEVNRALQQVRADMLSCGITVNIFDSLPVCRRIAIVKQSARQGKSSRCEMLPMMRMRCWSRRTTTTVYRASCTTRSTGSPEAIGAGCQTSR